jgi:hypothetical protein
MTTIHILLHSWIAAERVLEAAHDFSAWRAEVRPAVSLGHSRRDPCLDQTPPPAPATSPTPAPSPDLT